MSSDARVENSVANAGFEDGEIAPWSTNAVAANVRAAQAHSGSQSLAETPSGGTVFQDINGLEPGRPYTLSAWVSASPDAALTAQLTVYNPSDDTQTSSPVIRATSEWRPGSP